MANYGTKTGKGSVTGNITNNVTIKKSHLTLGITLSITIIVVLVALLIMSRTDSLGKKNILGTWSCDDGYVEFLSDGTLSTNLHSVSVKADTYELLEEGYLKWGRYDASWLQFEYTYWEVELSDNQLTLTMKDNPDASITLTKQ